MKRILNVKKTSRTTSLLYAVGQEPCEQRLDKMKLELFERLANNETTKTIIQDSVNKYNKNESIKNIQYRLLYEVVEITRK
jgi:hypothetical protein